MQSCDFSHSNITVALHLNIIESDILLQMVVEPMVHNKFCNLKFLGIALGGQNYDYLSLVSFFDACPSLQTFILNVSNVHPLRISINICRNC
jgi:hypothetical protein